MFVIIAYDIEDDKIRKKAADFLLENGGVRVQKSVFELNVENPKLREIKSGLKKFKIEKTDSIRYYHLCKDCAAKMEASGIEPATLESEGYMIF